MLMREAPQDDFCRRSRSFPEPQPVRSGNRLNEFTIEKIKATLPGGPFSRGSNQILNHFLAHFTRQNVTGVEPESVSPGCLAPAARRHAASGGEFRRRNSCYYRVSVSCLRGGVPADGTPSIVGVPSDHLGQDLRVSIQAKNDSTG